MIDRAAFDIEVFDVLISSRSSATTISLHLSEIERSESNPNCISGFPRTLVTEDQLRGKLFIDRKKTIHSHTQQMSDLKDAG